MASTEQPGCKDAAAVSAPPEVCNAPIPPPIHTGVTGGHRVLASPVVACAVLPGDMQHAGTTLSCAGRGHGVGLTPGGCGVSTRGLSSPPG